MGCEDECWIPAPVFAGGPALRRWLSNGWEGWVPAPRLHGGRISARTTGGRGSGRFANSPYQMVVRRVAGMGPRIPSSRGQDLDARTTGGGGLGLEVGDDGFEGLYGLVYVSVGVGEGGVELLGALEDSLLLDEVAEAGFDCVVGG